MAAFAPASHDPEPFQDVGDGLSRRVLLALSVGGVAGLSGVGFPVFAAPVAPAWTLYDPRFTDARPLAAKMASGGPLAAVGADVTPLLAPFGHGPDRGAMTIQGVTTETLPFCLHQALGRGRVADLRQHRLDQDLFAWSLHLREA